MVDIARRRGSSRRSSVSQDGVPDFTDPATWRGVGGASASDPYSRMAPTIQSERDWRAVSGVPATQGHATASSISSSPRHAGYTQHTTPRTSYRTDRERSVPYDVLRSTTPRQRPHDTSSYTSTRRSVCSLGTRSRSGSVHSIRSGSRRSERDLSAWAPPLPFGTEVLRVPVSVPVSRRRGERIERGERGERERAVSVTSVWGQRDEVRETSPSPAPLPLQPPVPVPRVMTLEGFAAQGGRGAGTARQHFADISSTWQTADPRAVASEVLQASLPAPSLSQSRRSRPKVARPCIYFAKGTCVLAQDCRFEHHTDTGTTQGDTLAKLLDFDTASTTSSLR